MKQKNRPGATRGATGEEKNRKAVVFLSSDDLKRASQFRKDPSRPEDLEFWCAEVELDIRWLKKTIESEGYRQFGSLTKATEMRSHLEDRSLVVFDERAFDQVMAASENPEIGRDRVFFVSEWAEQCSLGKFRSLVEAIIGVYGIDVTQTDDPAICMIETVHELISTMIERSQEGSGQGYFDVVAGRAVRTEKKPAPGKTPEILPPVLVPAEEGAPVLQPEPAPRAESSGKTGLWRSADPGLKLVSVTRNLERAFADILGGRSLDGCPERDLEVLSLISELSASAARMVLMDAKMHALAFEQGHLDLFVARTRRNEAFDELLRRRTATPNGDEPAAEPVNRE